MGWTFVGSTDSDGDGDTTGATTSAFDSTGADLLVALVGNFSAGTFTDSEGNTWTQLTRRDGGNPAITPYYVINPSTSASHTFSVSGGLQFPGISVLAFSADGSITFGAETGNTTSGTGINCGSLTPSEDGALLIAAQAIDNDGTNQSINLSYTEVDDLPWTNNVQIGTASAYLVQSTAAAINPTWSSGANVPRAASHFYFLEAGAINTTGIASGEAFGSHSVVNLGIIAPDGIASAEAFGTANLGNFQIMPGGIASGEAFGSHTVINAIFPPSIASAENVPGPLVITGHQRKPLVIGNGIIQQIRSGDTLLVPTALIVDNNSSRSSITIETSAATEASGAHKYIFEGKDSTGVRAFSITAFARTSGNMCFGDSAGVLVTTGKFNFGLAHNALAALTTGSRNIAIGNGAGIAVTTGDNNVMMGNLAGRLITTGGHNTLIGVNCGGAITTTQFNCGFGLNSLGATTGTSNCAFGVSSGLSITTGNSNTFVGTNAGNNASQLATAINSTAIGNGTFTTASHQVVLGNTNVTATVLRGAITGPTSLRLSAGFALYGASLPGSQPAFITAADESHSLGTTYNATEIQDALDALAVAVNDLRDMAIAFGLTASS